MSDRPLRIAALCLLLVAGVFAGAQLGKIAPLIPHFRDGLGFSLVEIGWLTSTIALFVALAALPVSLGVDRFGQFRVLVLGSLALLAGGLGLAASERTGAILAFRAVEASGYLVLVIVMPAILNGASPPQLRAPMLAIWGGFVPVGFAIADFAAATLLPGHGPRAFLLLLAVAFGVLALAAVLLLSRVREPSLAPARRHVAAALSASLSPAVWLVAAGFGLFVMLSIAFFAFLPAIAAREGAAFLVPVWLVALVVPAGNLLAGAAMAGRGLKTAVGLGAAGFLASALAAWPAFSGGDPMVATVAAILFAIAGGVTASALFASVPFIVPAGGSASVVIGFICQAGGIATLVGPPVAGFAIERWGWPGFTVLLLAISVAGLIVMAPLAARQSSGVVAR